MEKEINKRKVLYITYLWTGMNNFFLNGENQLYGMPAFYHPFQTLLKDNETQIDVILFIPKNKVEIKIPDIYKEKINVYPIFYNSKKDLLKNYFKILFFSKIDFKQYKIFFGHGPIGASLVSFLSMKYKIPNIKRIYGTFLNTEIEDLKIKIFFRHPLEYLAFALPGKAIIITNDGTHGDNVYKKIGNKNTQLNFLLNGIDKEYHSEKPKNLDFIIEKGFLTYIARIDTWKRQELLIDTYIQMNKEGYELLPLYIIGKVIDKNYYNKLTNKIQDNNLENKIYFTGGIQHSEVMWFLENSKITFSLYEVSNLGNVFIESLSLGVATIAINENNSLDYFPDDIFYKLESSDILEVIKAIKMILHDNSNTKTLKNKAKEWCKVNILSWKDRAQQEIDILKRYEEF